MKEKIAAEGDRVEFTDSGYRCVCIRHPLGLHWCGYVGVPPEHPWYGLPYNALVKLDDEAKNRPRSRLSMSPIDMFLHAMSDTPKDQVPLGLYLSIHGGLTYGDDSLPDREPDDLWYFGFDCNHATDISPGMRHPRELGDTVRGMFDKLEKMIGHAFDKGAVYRDKEYVVGECQSLASQLMQVQERALCMTGTSDKK